MSTPAMPVLELRCRDAEWIDRRATLDEFARPAAAPDPYKPLAELLITDMLARSQTEIATLLEGRVLFSVENARFGIPLGVRDLDTPSVDDWNIREQLEVDLLDASDDGRLVRSLAAQFRRGLIAVAGTLPLLASPILAHAHAPLEHDALTRVMVGFAPPKLPEDAQPMPAPAPAVTPEPSTTAPQVEPPPTAAPQVVPAPAPRIVNESLTLTGTVVWDGLLGQRVKLAMRNEQVLDGTVVAQSTTDLAVARSSDGTVVAVPKAEIAGVRLAASNVASGGAELPPHSERPTNDGHKLYGGGAVMIGFGSIAALAGTVMLGIYPSGLFISLPLLLPGLSMIGGGASMMASAAKKRTAYRRAWGIPATAKLKLTPTLAGSRSGGQVGLVLRF